MDRGCKSDMDEAQQSAMRVGQGPHEPPSLVGDVEVPSHLEAVHAFQHQTERKKEEQGPPAEPKMAEGQR